MTWICERQGVVGSIYLPYVCYRHPGGKFPQTPPPPVQIIFLACKSILRKIPERFGKVTSLFIASKSDFKYKSRGRLSIRINDNGS